MSEVTKVAKKKSISGKRPIRGERAKAGARGIPAQIVPGWFKILQPALGYNPVNFREVGRLNVVVYSDGSATETYFFHTETIGTKYRYEPTGGPNRTIDHWRFEKYPTGQGGAPTGIHYKIYVCNCQVPIQV